MDRERGLWRYDVRRFATIWTGVFPHVVCPSTRMNAKMTAEECIEIMVERIVRDFSPLQILLFGSRARGTACQDSDIDLIVVFPVVSDVYAQTARVRRSLGDLGFPMDVIVTTPEKIERGRALLGHVFYHAIPESRVLYDNAA